MVVVLWRHRDRLTKTNTVRLYLGLLYTCTAAMPQEHQCLRHRHVLSEAVVTLKSNVHVFQPELLVPYWYRYL